MLPFKSLDAVSGTTAGSIRDLEDSLGGHTMIVKVVGAPTAARVDLIGGHEPSAMVGLGTYVYGDASGGIVHVDRVVRYVRAEVVELDGGTNPSITATIASC
ncbi:hypothetical protein [Streptomyces tendae]|uniref:hypothetical protein n=1 Tax=Streptomyces tendae TaxID=1932 RepID=UPI0024934049|nr:hypothetical protein [Streptomyces tendae]